jgi:hypothetical protein
MQQIRREAGDGPAAAAATGERYRRYKAQLGSGFFIFLCREIAQAANHVGWKRELISFRTSQAFSFQA